MNQQNGHMLARALGYDPGVYHRKREAEAELNPADPINGDAQLSTTRRCEVAEQQTKITWENRAHTQDFADDDVGREQYDGLNLKASAPERVVRYLHRRMRLGKAGPGRSAQTHHP